MNLSRYWPLAILLLGMGGCNGTSPASAGKSAAELIESGKTALARGETDQALADFGAAVDAQPDSALARERRADAFLRMKKFDQVLYDCAEALKIDAKFAAAYFTRGVAEKDLGETGKALEDFTKALDNGFAPVDVLTARGTLYHSMAKLSATPDDAAKMLAAALKDLDGAVKLDPRRTDCRLQRGLVHLDMGDYAAAVADCDEALKADSDLAGAYLARARGECELSEFEHSIRDCDSALHQDEKLFEAHVIRAKARLEKSSQMRTLAEVAECGRAVDDCQKAIDLSKKFKGDAEGTKHAKSIRGQAHELRGSIYQNLRAVKKALAEYEQALSFDPCLVSALLRRAVTHTSEEDYGRALNDCRAAIDIDSVRAEAYSGRGWVYAIKREYPKAIEDFTQAVSLDDKCAEAYYRRAVVYSTMANQELARAQELASMKRPSDRAEIVAHAERVKDLWQKTIDDATKAIDRNSHMARAYLTRGVVYGRQRLFFRNQENLEKTRADFNAAIREDPAMARAYYNRGVFYAGLGQLDAAARDFEETSKLQPNHPAIFKALYQVNDKRKDPILSAKYKLLWQEKEKSKRAELEQDLDSIDFAVKRKSTPAPELRPDSELEPLDVAKLDLEKKLDATAEK